MADKLDGNAIIANTIPANRIQTGSITSTQLQTSLYNTVTSATHPKIRSISYPGNDTAANTGGGDTITLTGTGFGNTGNVQIYINGNVVSSITVTNANSISFTAPALAAATYPVYLINTSDGSTAILIPGIQYSGTPSWSTSTPLSNQDASSTWSIQLVATSDSAVSYSLQAGSSLPAGITLAANGLISGTMTSPPTDETTYNFTVVANDLENQDASRAFSVTVTVAVLDPYFTYTTLLLHGDGTNNANNHAFVDSSNNAFAITRNGNATQGTFSPFGDNWSYYFGGAGDYLQTPASSTSTIVGTLSSSTNLTIECWIFPTAYNSSANFPGLIGDMLATSENNNWSWGITNTGTLMLYWNVSGTQYRATSASGVSLNIWSHIALNVSSGAITMYINGVLQTLTGTTTLSTPSGTNNYLVIGQWNNGSGGTGGTSHGLYTGYISNLRIIKSSTYTSAFTPTTQPLTTISNNSLLICQSNAFVDKSPNRLTITRNGNTRVSKFDPFKPYKAIPASYGVYFDGTGDYLTVPDDANWNLTSSTGSYELFVYPVAAPSNTPGLIGQCPTTANWGTYLYSDGRIGVGIQGTSELAAAAGSLTVGAWNHIVFTRDNSDSRTRIFVNGVLKATGTGTYFNDSSAALHIGHFNNYSFNGHISNVRVCKGSIPSSYITSNTTVGTTIFTTPTSALTAVANTVLLACQSTTIIDNSANAYTITTNGDARPTDFNPFTTTFVSEKYNTANGGGAVYFDGSGDYLTGPNNSAVSTSGGNYLTCEAWIYPTSHGSERTVFFRLQLSGSYPGYILRLDNGFPLIGSSSNDLTSSVAAQLNAWNHVAFVFDSSGNQSIYLNGVRTATRSNGPTTMDYSSNLIIGGDGTGTRNFFGYIASARIIKQSTPYYSGTTINVLPSAPFTAISNTSFLCNFTNAGILDSVGKNVLETIGDARVNTSVKKYGTGSMYFDGNGDVLSIVDDELHRLTSGDFTIECWVYPTANGALYDSGFASYGAASTLAGWFFGMSGTNTGGTLNRLIWSVNYSASGGAPVYGNAGLPLNTWTHAAVTKVGTTINLFINGVLDKTATVTATPTTNTSYKLYIGAASYDPTGTQRSLTGNIDDLRITRGVARYRYNFTPPTKAFNDGDGNLANNTTDVLVGDQVNLPVFPYTTLLLHGDGTNNANNHAFLDSSNNAFTITRNGNATQGTFSPFSPTGWSGYIDNSSQYISYGSSADFTFGTGDFTVEAWVYVSSVASSNLFSIFNVGSAATGSYSFYVRADGKIESVRYGDSAGSGVTSTAISFNTWNHIAAVRSGGTSRVYINGLADSGSSYSMGSVSASAGETGRVWQSAYTSAGYVSNLRVCKGTAVYTSNFTPTTTLFTSTSQSAANCVLLTLQSSRFVDNNTTVAAKTITISGSPSIQAFSPFAPSVEYTANTHGGSAYFDGTGDYLSLTSNTAFDGSSTWSVEFWVYPTYSSGNDKAIIGNMNPISYPTNYPGWDFIAATPSTVAFRWGYPNYTDSGAIAYIPYAWNHLAVSISGGRLSFYINGTRVYTTTTNTNISASTAAMYIGWSPLNNSVFNGYIAHPRITKGSTPYDPTLTTLTVPTSPVTAIANTQLLCNFTNAGILDSTGKNVLETVGDARVNTAIKKYGTGSMYFDGTGDWLLTRASPNLDMGTGDLTIEGWFYLTATVAVDYRMIVSDATNGNNYVCIRGGGTGGQLEINVSGVSFRLNLNNTVVINTWFHLAVTRYNGTWYAFVNGLSLGTSASASAFNLGNGGMYIGRFGGATAYEWPGYIDDLRITKGIARYVTNFTPPTAAFLNK